jgi:hypothetical protein
MPPSSALRVDAARRLATTGTHLNDAKRKATQETRHSIAIAQTRPPVSHRAETDTSAANVRLEFDFDQMGRVGELCHLDHGCHWPNMTEHFLVRAPDLGLRGDVCDIHPGTNYLLRGCTGRLQSVERDAKCSKRLPVWVAWMEHSVQTGRCRASGDSPVSSDDHARVAVHGFQWRHSGESCDQHSDTFCHNVGHVQRNDITLTLDQDHLRC